MQFRFTKPMQSRPGHWLFCKKCKTYNCGILFLQTNANKMHFFCSFGSPNPSNQGHFFFSKNAIELTIFTKFLKKMQIFCFQIWFPKPVQSKPGHWLFLQKMQTIAKNCKTNAIGGPLNRLFFRIFWVVFLIFSYFLFFLIWTKIRKIRKHEK